jgi:oligosaccharide repeat unit polymerase
MVLFGYVLFPYTIDHVKIIDETLLPKALFLYCISILFFTAGFVFYDLIPKKTLPERRGSWIRIDIILYRLFIFMLVASLMLIFVWYKVGYIPVFHHAEGAKYFQDSQEKYIPLRPIYTLGLSVLTSLLIILLVIYQSVNKNSLCKIKIAILIGVTSIIILMTGKRGNLLSPFIYYYLALFFYGKVRLKKLIGFSSTIVIFSSAIYMLHFYKENAGFIASLGTSIGNSLFVGVRELTRLLTVFDGIYIKGLTYLAAIISFIPTEYSDIKKLYFYPRYIMYLEGSDPNMSGGMRAGYIGEAFINFGYFGVYFISFLFGILFGAIIDLSMAAFKLISKDMFFSFVCVVFMFHQGFIAFFESGSAAMFHLASRLFFIIMIYKLAIGRVRLYSQ